MTITQVITALPPAPSPSSDTPAEFGEKAAASVLAQMALPTEINAWSAQANAMVAEANAAAALAQQSGDLVLLAQAAANFKGNYSALTGALTMPASVAYSNDNWALNTNTSNVVSDVPGVSSKWTRLRTGPGGALETTTAGSVVLTNASARVQSIATTAADQTVTLMNATLVGTGGVIISVENAGLFQFVVRNASAGFLIALEPGQSATFSLVNNGTAAGVWDVGLFESSLAHSIYQATGVTINAASSTGPYITPLASGLALLVYRVSSNLWAVPLTISGVSVTAGVPYDLGSTGNEVPTVTQMTNATAIVVYLASGGTTTVQARHLTVIGTGAGATISPGTALTVNAVSSLFPTITSMSGTEAVLVYQSASGANLYARTLTVSGTSLSPGTEATVRSGTAGLAHALTTMWGSQALLVSMSSGGSTQAHTLNVSAGVVTPGAAFTLNADGYWPAVIALSSTQALLHQNGNNGESTITRVLTIAGTDVTGGPVSSEHHYAIASTPSSRAGLARLAVNRVMAFRITAGVGTVGSYNGRIQMFGATDGEVFPGKSSNMKASYGPNVCLAVLTPTKVIAAYTQASGYAQVRVLEIGA